MPAPPISGCSISQNADAVTRSLERYQQVSEHRSHIKLVRYETYTIFPISLLNQPRLLLLRSHCKVPLLQLFDDIRVRLHILPHFLCGSSRFRVFFNPTVDIGLADISPFDEVWLRFGRPSANLALRRLSWIDVRVHVVLGVATNDVRFRLGATAFGSQVGVDGADGCLLDHVEV